MRILIPYDGSDPAERAIEYVVENFPEAEATLLHVVPEPTRTMYDEAGLTPPFGEGRDERLEEMKNHAVEVLEEASEEFTEAGVDVSTDIEVGNPAHRIIETADEGDYDHVVMGSHGRKGIQRVVLGSVAETVLRESTTPITVIR